VDHQADRAGANEVTAGANHSLNTLIADALVNAKGSFFDGDIVPREAWPPSEIT
jgi:hypothetical protein